MKLNFFAIFILLISRFAVANADGTFKSFIHGEITKWLYDSPQDACFENEFIAYEDTVINNLKYKKLWRGIVNYIEIDTDFNVNSYNQLWRGTPSLSYEMGGYIRQSDDSSKLYLYNRNKDVEYLVADMNLNIGDKFEFPGYDTDQGDFVVDTIYTMNGLKVIEFSRSYYLLKFIEGVGPTIQFTRLLENDGSYNNYLICSTNQNYFYNINLPCGCISTAGTLDVYTDKIKVEKLSRTIEISYNQPANRIWELFDIYGRKLNLSQNIEQKSTKLTFSISNLSNGIYLIRVINNDNSKIEILKINI